MGRLRAVQSAAAVAAVVFALLAATALGAVVLPFNTPAGWPAWGGDDQNTFQGQQPLGYPHGQPQAVTLENFYEFPETTPWDLSTPLLLAANETIVFTGRQPFGSNLGSTTVLRPFVYDFTVGYQLTGNYLNCNNTVGNGPFGLLNSVRIARAVPMLVYACVSDVHTPNGINVTSTTYAVDPMTFATLWTQTGHYQAVMDDANQRVFLYTVAFEGYGSVLAVDMGSGHMLWYNENQFNETDFYTLLGLDGGATMLLALASTNSGNTSQPNWSTVLYALSPSNGTTLWSTPLPWRPDMLIETARAAALVIAGDRLVFPVEVGAGEGFITDVYALELSTQKFAWNVTGLSLGTYVAATDGQNMVYVLDPGPSGTPNVTLNVLSLSDGSILFQVALNKSYLPAIALDAAGTLWIGGRSDDGHPEVLYVTDNGPQLVWEGTTLSNGTVSWLSVGSTGRLVAAISTAGGTPQSFAVLTAVPLALPVGTAPPPYLCGGTLTFAVPGLASLAAPIDVTCYTASQGAADQTAPCDGLVVQAAQGTVTFNVPTGSDSNPPLVTLGISSQGQTYMVNTTSLISAYQVQWDSAGATITYGQAFNTTFSLAVEFGPEPNVLYCGASLEGTDYSTLQWSQARPVPFGYPGYDDGVGYYCEAPQFDAAPVGVSTMTLAVSLVDNDPQPCYITTYDYVRHQGGSSTTSNTGGGGGHHKHHGGGTSLWWLGIVIPLICICCVVIAGVLVYVGYVNRNRASGYLPLR